MKRKQPDTEIKTREAVRAPRISWTTLSNQHYAKHLVLPLPKGLKEVKIRGRIRAALIRLVSAADYFTIPIRFCSNHRYEYGVPNTIDSICSFNIMGFHTITNLMIVVGNQFNHSVIITPQDWYQLAQKVQENSEDHHQALTHTPLPGVLFNVVKEYMNLPRQHNWTGFLESLPKEMTGMFLNR